MQKKPVVGKPKSGLKNFKKNLILIKKIIFRIGFLLGKKLFPKNKPLLKNKAVVFTVLIIWISPLVVRGFTILPTPAPVVSATPERNIYQERLDSYDVDSVNSPHVLVNKSRPLNPIKYEPVNKGKIGSTWVAKPVDKAYKELKKVIAAKKLGTLCLNSAYRSHTLQHNLHGSIVASLGKEEGEALAARPGYSEHQTGLAIDVSVKELSCRIGKFGEHKASKWISENAWRYGFIVRYPKDKTPVTGYAWEAWHLRYVGLRLAAEMKSNKIETLEEFFGLPVAPEYTKLPAKFKKTPPKKTSAKETSPKKPSPSPKKQS